MNEIKNKIFQYIQQEYVNRDEGKRHYPYCKFPEEDCSCKSIDNFDFDTSLIRGGFIDSFEMVSVLVFVESTFKVRIPEKEATAENFDTVSKIAQLVMKYKI